QSVRLLGASAAARGPAGDRDRLDRRLSPLCWITALTRRFAPRHTARTVIANPAGFRRPPPSGGGSRADAPRVEGRRGRAVAQQDGGLGTPARTVSPEGGDLGFRRLAADGGGAGARRLVWLLRRAGH